MRTSYRKISPFLLSWLLVLGCTVLPAFAEDSAPDPTTTSVGLAFRWVNFGLVFGGLAFILFKFGGPYFRERGRAISQSIREAADARAAAEREVAAADQRLANLKNEIEGLRQAGLRESAAEGERIRALARSEAAKVAEVAKAEIAAAERAGQQEVRSIAARVATERAATLMGQRINSDMQASLFQAFVEKLERSAS